MAKAKQRALNKGWFVNLPKEITDMILARCEESMREPKQEIVWMLRDWMRRDDERVREETKAVVARMVEPQGESPEAEA